jgi:hypothetical protein
MNRGTENKSISIAGDVDKVVYAIVAKTSAGAFLAAMSAPDATCKRIVADPENFASDSLRGKFLRNLLQRRASTAVFMRRTVHKQNFHLLQSF